MRLAHDLIDSRDSEALLSLFVQLALEAGPHILDVYRSAMAVGTKSDDSPVTEADRRSEQVILAGLRGSCPSVTCVAEEELAEGHVVRGRCDTFVLIDPLDGTREFINRKADFTVNIALVRDRAPVLGVVYAPARGVLFTGGPSGAFRFDVDSGFRSSGGRAITVSASAPKLRIVASRSHRTPQTDAFIARYPGAEIAPIGSSLKFCLIAEGQADLYPRFGRTMEWDTAAGDAVLRAAGGMTTTLDGSALRYGKRNQVSDTDFANPPFIAAASPMMEKAAL